MWRLYECLPSSCDKGSLGDKNMDNLVNLTINDINTTVSSDVTILEAANALGIYIPRLCFLKGVNENASCRICLVEIEGMHSLKNSCSIKVSEGMVVKTNTQRVRSSVKQSLELLAKNHRFDCWKCSREENCEFLNLLRRYGIDSEVYINSAFEEKTTFLNDLSNSIVIDTSKCILCGRCVSACETYAGKGILNYNRRGFVTFVAPALNHDLDDSGCIYCGKCIQSCPVGAIHEKEEIEQVEDALYDENKFVVVQVAPSVRAALGEEFGLPIGTNVEGQLYAALKQLGFDDITDTTFAADLTIMEEGYEFLTRLKSFMKGEEVKLPMFTSCSPGWIRYVERYYPEYLGHLSTTKSPQQIQGAIIKHYYANKIGIDRNNIHVVSVMPCVAKKDEAKRPEMVTDGTRDVDNVLTTRELARLIKRHQIDFVNLKPYQPTSPLAEYTGAGVIFGATGGVMEAALRSVYEILEGKPLANLDFKNVRGVENGIKETTVTIRGYEINIAVIHGGINIKHMMERLKKGDKTYHLIEVMGCVGGCVNGGGQPIVPANILEKINLSNIRAKALYRLDKQADLRLSHLNPTVKKLYEEFLGSPNSPKANHILHTTYTKKESFSNI